MSASGAVPRRTWRDWLGLACRLVLGGVLLASGVLKARSFEGSVYAVEAFQILPPALVPAVGYALPIVEIVVGLLLVLGLFTRISAIVGAVLMLAFILGIASLWARGMKVDCGCFGGGGPNDAVGPMTYLTEILRDVAIMLPALYLAFRPRTPFAADGWLFRDIPTAPYDDED